ncbi:MAG: hypothetical protein R2754_13950 [Microthrixaceae bacterium]
MRTTAFNPEQGPVDLNDLKPAFDPKYVDDLLADMADDNLRIIVDPRMRSQFDDPRFVAQLDDLARIANQTPHRCRRVGRIPVCW